MTGAAKNSRRCSARRPMTSIGLTCIWTFKIERNRSANRPIYKLALRGLLRCPLPSRTQDSAVVRGPPKIPFVRQTAFYARTLIEAIVLARVWHNSRAHHSTLAKRSEGCRAGAERRPVPEGQHSRSNCSGTMAGGRTSGTVAGGRGLRHMRGRVGCRSSLRSWPRHFWPPREFTIRRSWTGITTASPSRGASRRSTVRRLRRLRAPRNITLHDSSLPLVRFRPGPSLVAARRDLTTRRS